MVEGQPALQIPLFSGSDTLDESKKIAGGSGGSLGRRKEGEKKTAPCLEISLGKFDSVISAKPPRELCQANKTCSSHFIKSTAETKRGALVQLETKL